MRYFYGTIAIGGVREEARWRYPFRAFVTKLKTQLWGARLKVKSCNISIDEPTEIKEGILISQGKLQYISITV